MFYFHETSHLRQSDLAIFLFIFFFFENKTLAKISEFIVNSAVGNLHVHVPTLTDKSLNLTSN